MKVSLSPRRDAAHGGGGGADSDVAVHHRTPVSRFAPAQQVRILHVMDKLSVDGSGIAGPARQLAYRLPQYPRARYKTLVCSLRSEEGAREFLLQSGVEVVCLGRSKFDVRVLGDLQRLVTEWKPAILHLHGYASWTFGRIVGRQTETPVVVQEHFTDESVPRIQRLADWVLRKQQGLGLAVSDTVREFMKHGRYVNDTPTDVIWNAVPVDAIRREAAEADTARLRASLDIPPDAPVVGITGRLARGKGHDCFLDAAAAILRAKPETRFVVVGAGPLRGALEERAESLGLGERVAFVGHQSNVVPFLSLFSVSVLPSISEGFLAVALESLAAGTPVVLTDLEAYRGVHVHEKSALLVPVNDPAATAAAAIRLLCDSGLTRRLLNGSQPLLAACSLNSVAQKYLECYERLLYRGADQNSRMERRVTQGA